MKKKTQRKSYTLDHHLTALEKKLSTGFNPLYLEELMDVLRTAKKQEMLEMRNKLTKLEMSLSFRLENGQLEPHIEVILEEFLSELTLIINKTNKIY